MVVGWVQWLQSLPASVAMRESLWLFPALGWIHLCSMTLLITMMALLDTRLMGIAILPGTRQPLRELSKRVLGWSWICVSVNAVTGAFLFASHAVDYYGNTAFRIKMLLVLSGVVYHSILFPTIILPRATRWEESSQTPIEAKAAGAFSLLLWAGVVAASQWIAAG